MTTTATDWRENLTEQGRKAETDARIRDMTATMCRLVRETAPEMASRFGRAALIMLADHTGKMATDYRAAGLVESATILEATETEYRTLAANMGRQTPEQSAWLSRVGVAPCLVSGVTARKLTVSLEDMPNMPPVSLADSWSVNVHIGSYYTRVFITAEQPPW